jgi:type III restriction enzyme
MNLKTKYFQDQYIADLVFHLRAAAVDAVRKPVAVSLSAPTGSGKTVMVTAALEAFLSGDDEGVAVPDATYLWLSDSPELNEQSRRKILAISSVFGANDLRIIDSDFDEVQLTPGVIYFLNAQKLGKDKRLVKTGEDRDFTIWQTLNNTTVARQGKFIVILDEAHRGMRTAAEERDAATIVQRFVKGDPETGLKPVPVLLGISATPKRFLDIIQGVRIHRPVEVSPADVRDSGLLKDVIRWSHPLDKRSSPLTLLKRALQSFKEYRTEWEKHCKDQGIEIVRPVMAIQVADASAKSDQISTTDLQKVLDLVEQELGVPAESATAHAFDTRALAEVGGRQIRYLAPSDIQDDPTVRVVLFKSSLTTGWDCPRAEVMMSFRTSVDATVIAQLVGRMVRTPLAHRITGNEFLNSVALYLPFFDQEELGGVIKYLESEEGSPVKVVKDEDLVSLVRRDGTDECFSLLTTLPSYSVPGKRRINPVNRLCELGRLLNGAGISPRAQDDAQSFLLDLLEEEVAGARKTAEYKQALKDQSSVKLVERVQAVLGGWVGESTSELTVSEDDVERVYDHDVRPVLKEGLEQGWLRRRVKGGKAGPAVAAHDARVEMIALLQDENVVPRLHAKAEVKAAKWFDDFAPAVLKEDEDVQRDFDELRASVTKVEVAALRHPQKVEFPKSDESRAQHIYALLDGSCPVVFGSSWERLVIDEELKKPSVVGWLRNIAQRPWALAVPYENPEAKLFWPDFLVFRKVKTGFTVDILDPHDATKQDAAPKAVGLAKYVAKHGGHFGRVELIRMESGVLQRLDLKDAAIRAQVVTVTTSQHLQSLYKTLGKP